MPTAKITRIHYRCGRISCSLPETQRGIYPKTQAARTRPYPPLIGSPRMSVLAKLMKAEPSSFGLSNFASSFAIRLCGANASAIADRVGERLLQRLRQNNRDAA